MKKHKIKGELFLLTTSIIWGAAFVFQKLATELLDPFTFNTIRYILGGLLLIPVYFYYRKGSQINASIMADPASADPASADPASVDPASADPDFANSGRTTFWGGIICGVILALAGNIQQFGIVTTDAGKTAFITTLYIVIVPVFGLIIFRKKVRNFVWIGVLFALVGLYFLSIKPGGFSMEKGDFLVFVSAFFWAAHILAVDQLAPRVDAILLSCTQFIWAGVFSSVFMIIFAEPHIADIIACWAPIMFTSVFVVAVAFTFQIIGQKTTEPAVASILLSLESVFGVIAGMVFLHEMMSGRELLGCILMFTAVVMTQLPERKNHEQLK